MSLIEDLRLDIGDDVGVVYASGSGSPIVSDEYWTSDEALNLIVDLRLDIGDDEEINYASISGLTTLSGPLYPVIWGATDIYSSTYTIVPTDVIIFVWINPATIILPASPVLGQIFYIKDALGNASIGNITIDPNGNNIEGNSFFLLSINKQSIAITWNGSEWSII